MVRPEPTAGSRERLRGLWLVQRGRVARASGPGAMRHSSRPGWVGAAGARLMGGGVSQWRDGGGASAQVGGGVGAPGA